MELKINTSILNSISEIDSAYIKKAVGALPNSSVCGVVIHGISDTEDYHNLLDRLKSVICTALGQRVPVTLVPHYLLPVGGFSLDIYTLDGEVDIRMDEQSGVCCGYIVDEDEAMLLVEGIPASDFSQGVASQSVEVFDKLCCRLSAYGFAIDDMVRQWNYIGNIVSYRGGKQNYQEFNDVRSHYYKDGAWHNGYPAATGIGASFEGVIVGGVAFKRAKNLSAGVYPIDNPWQVAAHNYSERVLIDDAADAVKSTPKFERAKLIETERGVCCFVSGTAAIRGEDSMDSCSVVSQTIQTIENIKNLVSKENLVRYGCRAYDLKYSKLHIFIKEEGDYESVKSVVEEYYPNVAVTYTMADICRDELLVEIESILTL